MKEEEITASVSIREMTIARIFAVVRELVFKAWANLAAKSLRRSVHIYYHCICDNEGNHMIANLNTPIFEEDAGD